MISITGDSVFNGIDKHARLIESLKLGVKTTQEQRQKIYANTSSQFEKWRYQMFRSSYQRCSVTKVVLRNFAKFTGKHLCQCLMCQPATLLKKRLWHRCFPVNFAKFLRTSFSQNTSRRLLLNVVARKW